MRANFSAEYFAFFTIFAQNPVACAELPHSCLPLDSSAFQPITPRFPSMQKRSPPTIYNKNGNKLDFYGKVNAEHDFVTSGDNTNNNDATYAQIGFKGETQINDQLTGYGQWEYRFLANQAENGAQTNKTVWHSLA